MTDPGPHNRRRFWFWGLVAISIVLLWVFLLNLLMFLITTHRYSVSSGSMKPTLLAGDIVHVGPIGDVARGDVLVFQHPNSNVVFIKRLIGMPGDSLQMSNGRVFLNDAMLAYSETQTPYDEIFEHQGAFRAFPVCAEFVQIGEVCKKTAQVETLPNGRAYSILNAWDNGQLDNTLIFTVPEGHYFFLGDNRDNSADSRVSQTIGGIGFVPAENLRYRLRWTVWSFKGQSIWQFWTWRMDRIFKEVV